MLEFKKIELSDEESVLPMVKEFYSSDAVDHPVKDEILMQTFTDVAGAEPSVEGYLLRDQGEVVGFAYLTTCYACEIGGKVMILEEIFINEEHRGKGYGKQFFQWMIGHFQDIKRFRLEVTEVNRGAIRLYESLGFEFLAYEQMILDR